ncbi:MAG: DUF6702 family protein [Candidatus Longimicrobiales bacterium M2_2A_002]
MRWAGRRRTGSGGSGRPDGLDGPTEAAHGRSPGWRAALAGLAVALVLGSTAPAVHDLHETYADLAIDGAVVGGRVQFFQDQLERALGPEVGADAVALTPGATADSLVMGYIRENLVLIAHGDTLRPALLRSGREQLQHHTAWWVALHYEAAEPIDTLRVRNTLLFDLHDDQRNIMRFVRFPEETRETVTLEPARPDAVVTAR